jgi:hypothetical protein
MKSDNPHNTTSISRLYVTAVAVILSVLGLMIFTGSREIPAKTDQSGRIKFPHATHVEGAGLQCIDCHTTATASKVSGDILLPKKENCQSCHEEQLSKDCRFCHTSSDSTSYRRLLTPDRELTFSHELHTQGQKIACETCHKNLDAKKEVVGELVPAMTTCTTCHNAVTATNACETCHTNLASLRPATHNRTNFLREHKQLARLGDATCTSCHTQESCNDCHAGGAVLAKIDKSGGDLMTPRSPRLIAIDRGQGSTLSKVHDLNFKYTHGVAAKGKQSDCQTCHREDQFCSTCHAAGGDVNQSAFKPAWHSATGFVTIGVGSGGGEHAKRARRDLESCASCHGLETSDPVCTTCHTDPDGIKGNNPKTHVRGYMATTNGAWHSDPGATCFVCHTDPNARVGGAKGKGFCGYCHS